MGKRLPLNDYLLKTVIIKIIERIQFQVAIFCLQNKKEKAFLFTYIVKTTKENSLLVNTYTLKSEHLSIFLKIIRILGCIDRM